MNLVLRMLKLFTEKITEILFCNATNKFCCLLLEDVFPGLSLSPSLSLVPALSLAGLLLAVRPLYRARSMASFLFFQSLEPSSGTNRTSLRAQEFPLPGQEPCGT